MAVQDYKINYKSDFVLNINGDAGWATQFCIKFWTGMPSQAYFVGFDGVKYVNCRVGDTPTQLLVMFDDHHLPIGKLMMQIAYHTTIEEFPGSVFDEVTNARDVIVTIDGTDYQVMLDFTGEDAPELEFDLPAYANEAERIQNELQRQQNEADRIAAELQREQATAAAVQGAENVNAQLNGTTLTITNRQGMSTSVNTKGEQGAQGPVGPEGPQGQTGVSITDFSPKSQTETALIYTATFSDGHTQDVSIPKGPKGDTGATGPTGPTGPQGQTGVSITGLVKTGETETDTLYNVTFSDGTTQAVAIPKGEKGDRGPAGPTGPQGPMGDVAVITPEQQTAFTMYSVPGQNTDGPMTQKATTDALNSLAASDITYQSDGSLAADDVQGALDETINTIGNGISVIGQKLKEEYTINSYSINSGGSWANSGSSVVTKLIPVTEEKKLLLKSQNNTQFLYSWLIDDTNCSTGGAASIPSGYAARYIKNGSIIVDVPNDVKIIAIRADNDSVVYEPLVYELIESEDIKYTEFKELDTSSFTIYPHAVQTNGKWDSTGASTMIIPVESGWKVKLHTQTGYNSIYSILTNIDNISINKSIVRASEGCAPRTLMDINSETIIIVPSDAHYIGLRCDGNLLPSVSISKPIKEIVMSREDIEKMMTIDNRNINFDNYPEYEPCAMGGTNGDIWQDPETAISIFIPVTAGDTLTIKAPSDTDGVFYAMLTSNEHNTGTVNNFASGWTSRASLSAGESIDVVVPSDARYMWLWKSFQGNNLLPLSITSEMGVSNTYEELLNGLQEQIDDINNAPHSEDTYFNQADFSPLEHVDRPLIYAADNKVNANHIVNAIAYPNGVIIAARSGGSIVRIDLDGTETTLLIINGSTDWRGLWMDSNLNVYASPFNGVNQDGSATNIGNGIYRMPYGGNSFTKVLTLSAGYCIWTFCEDNDGYLYAGNYQVITNNPLLYRSSDNGQTWQQIFDFRGSGLVPLGRHVHSVIFNRYNNALYTIIGEVNEVYKSTDHGATWTALGVQFVTKGSAMVDTPYGILVGSDGAYFCDIDLIYPDDKNHKRVSRAWADTIFAIRQSDISNNIYAFCKIDSSVMSSSYYPQMADVTDTEALQAWINSSPSQLASWQEYYNAMKDIYPDDAVRPQHFMILMSPDFGQTWKIIYREAAGAINADGFWTIGYFKNGECLAGRVKSSGNTRDFIQPIVISEGSHRYTTTGIDCEGEIFVRTCLTNIVQPL